MSLLRHTLPGRRLLGSVYSRNLTASRQTDFLRGACRICAQARNTNRKSAGGYKRSQPSENGTGHDLKGTSIQQTVPVISQPADKAPARGKQHEGKYFDAVVKVYCTHSEPNFSVPWQRKRQYSSTSSGFMVKNEQGQRCLLTNAHSVSYHSKVKVKRRGDDHKFIAKVLAIGVECDIALLTVEDEEFWEDVKPLAFGPLPRLQDAVTVVGYPIGGDTISVTSGVVSRIEVTTYAHGSTDLLGIQIDAAINSGNSGGPVFNEVGNCVGIAFQGYSADEAENIGYVIPTPVIEHFLTDFRRNGKFTGFPVMGIRWQRMESESLRTAYKMKKGQKGILVRHIQPTYEAAQHLKADDIIMRFDDTPVASDGTVPFREKERIAFNYLTTVKYTGDKAKLDVWRDGKELQLTVQLMQPRMLVPPHLDNKDPSYFVLAGFVFTVFSEPYLISEWGSDYLEDAPVKLVERQMHGERTKPDEQVVILCMALACDANLGYEDYCNIQILKFNGVPVNNLKHLIELATICNEEYMRLDLAYKEVIVLKTSMVREATQEILDGHAIPSMVSKDLLTAYKDAKTESGRPVLAPRPKWRKPEPEPESDDESDDD